MSGEELYQMYVDGMVEIASTEVYPWDDLDQEEQVVWSEMADKLQLKEDED